MTQRGKFISIEGTEGVGKSTGLATIAEEVVKSGRKVVITREPGGTPTGERIRALLLDKTEQQMTPLTELLLMFAARSQHVETVIEPALARGDWVVCDRFTDSSYAYQGGGRLLGESVVAKLEALVLGDLRPDLTIILDIDVGEGLQRAATVSTADRFEAEELEFFERVRTAFVTRAASDDRFKLVDASRSLGEVKQEIAELVKEITGQ